MKVERRTKNPYELTTCFNDMLLTGSHHVWGGGGGEGLWKMKGAPLTNRTNTMYIDKQDILASLILTQIIIDRIVPVLG